jgi:tRNA uridine 5-carbamoylmethylation protein Kti12
MKSFCRNSGIILILVVFAMSIFAPASASAIGKQKIYELSKQIKELDVQIKEAYAELRRLNEEGGPDAQIKAQVLMQQIKEMRKEQDFLKEQLKEAKKIKNNNRKEDNDNESFKSRPRRR